MNAKKNNGINARRLKTNTSAVPRLMMGPKIRRRVPRSRPRLNTINAQAASTQTKTEINVLGCGSKFWANVGSVLAN